MTIPHRSKFPCSWLVALALLAVAAATSARGDQLFRLYLQGRNAYNARDYAKAAESWSAVLAIDPKDTIALSNRALAYKELKQWNKAAEDAGALIALMPDDPGAYDLRGDIYHAERESVGYAPAATDDTRKTVDDYTTAVKMMAAKEAAPEQWLRHGGAAKDPGNLEREVASCTAILQFAPNDAKVILARGGYYLMLAMYDQAIADFDAVLKLEPNNNVALEQRIQARGQEQGTSPKLLPENTAKDIDDLSEVIRRRPVSGNYVRRGEVYERAGDYDKAMADYQQALALSGGKDNGAYEGMADIYAADGDWKKALENYNHIIDTNDYGDLTNHAEIYDFRAKLYLNSGEYEKSIADVNKCIEGQIKSMEEVRKEYRGADPDGSGMAMEEKFNRQCMAGYFVERGEAWLRSGDDAKALEDFNRAIEEDMAGSKGLNARAWLHAASANAKNRDGSKAVELAMKACGLSSWQKSGDIDTLAAAYAESGKWQDAVNYEKLAIKIAMDDGKMPDRSAAMEKQQAELIKSYNAREALYENKKPFRGNKDLADWEE